MIGLVCDGGCGSAVTVFPFMLSVSIAGKPKIDMLPIGWWLGYRPNDTQVHYCPSCKVRLVDNVPHIKVSTRT